MGLLPAVTDRPLVPAGISHDVDLSGMTQGQRQRHHTQELRRIAKWQGIEGANAYKERHPEAAHILIGSQPRAYVAKPAGYRAAIMDLVALWFDSDGALAASNRDDVARLNAKLGTEFDPDRFFSRALSPSILNGIADLFDRQGAYLDHAKVKSMSQVRQAVRSIKSGSIPEGRPFAGIGIRTDRTLTLGGRTFRVESHKGRECVRVSSGGARHRIALDGLAELLAGLAVPRSGESSPPSICIYTGELAPSAENAPSARERTPMGASSHSDSHISENGNWPLSHFPTESSCDPSLSDRLAALRADRWATERLGADRLAAAQAEAAAASRDILEL